MLTDIGKTYLMKNCILDWIIKHLIDFEQSDPYLLRLYGTILKKIKW